MFGDERAAVIEGLPSLEESSNFFQTTSNGPAHGSLEDMQQDTIQAASSDVDDSPPEDMDQTDLPEPAAPAAKTPVGEQRNLKVVYS